MFVTQACELSFQILRELPGVVKDNFRLGDEPLRTQFLDVYADGYCVVGE